MKKKLLFTISLIMAVCFLFSPMFLKIEFVSGVVRNCLEGLEYQEYKSSFIGGVGGMIGTFLAITSTLLVESIITKDNHQELTETNAFILYYDVKLFYSEVSELASKMKRIMSIKDIDIMEHNFKIFKNDIGIHIHSDWISVVASMKTDLDFAEIEALYSFYGQVTDIKRIIEKENVFATEIATVNRIMEGVGIINTTYVPNEKYEKILQKLKVKAKIV